MRTFSWFETTLDHFPPPQHFVSTFTTVESNVECPAIIPPKDSKALVSQDRLRRHQTLLRSSNQAKIFSSFLLSRQSNHFFCTESDLYETLRSAITIKIIDTKNRKPKVGPKTATFAAKSWIFEHHASLIPERLEIQVKVFQSTLPLGHE